MKKLKQFSLKYLSLIITISLFIVLFIFGSLAYKNFMSLSTLLNLLNDNAHLIIVSVGITFVLITGGIDISVASTLAFTCVFSAWLLNKGLSAMPVITIVLVIGAGFGALMGSLIHYFKIQPFIITLAGQFLLRGMCAVISTESIPITNPFYKRMALDKILIGGGKLYYYVLISLAIVIVAWYTLRYTQFGRNIYAIGGNEKSALLMGLSVAKTKILVYTISSFCAALGGVIFSFYTLAGYSLQNVGLELDAISSSVIGGVQLTGGVGTPVGSVFGVMIQGIIQNLVTYQNLNTWWTKVANAALLCIFIIVQKMIAVRTETKTK